MRYDIDAEQLASDMVQARYADECFVLTATYTDNYYHNPDIVDGQTVMVRFELKHLGEFGYATDALDYRFGEQQSRRLRLTARPNAVPLDGPRPARRATGPPLFV